jgi:hypothetical protein
VLTSCQSITPFADSPPLDLYKVRLDFVFGHIGDLGRVLWYFAGEQCGVLFVKVDQLLANLPSLLIVRLEQIRVCQSTQNEVHLERQVVRIDQCGVHSLTGFGRVRVTGVSSHEHSTLNIVLVDQSLTDGIRAPPFRLDKLEGVGREDLQSE